MQEIPVYLFTGFMDSGKTTLIKETLFENDFGGDNRTVITVSYTHLDSDWVTRKAAPCQLPSVSMVYSFINA